MAALIGHAAAVAAMRAAMDGARLHHAWLLAGPQGIGKGRFAEAAALRLLAEATWPLPHLPGLDLPGTHSVAILIAAGSHPDYRRLARATRDGREDVARSITVEQVRGLQPLFATTPSLSTRRVIVIDAIDDLERPAANALLKNLEEPPADTVFLLVSHAPGRLLPTIRSRCRLLRFAPLDDAEVGQVLRDELPHADADEIRALVRIAGGAPGTALRFAGLDIAALDGTIERLARDGDPHNAIRTALARSLSGKAAQPRYHAFLERAAARLAVAARTGPVAALDVAVALWRQAIDIGERAIRESNDPQATVFEVAGLLARLAPGPAPAKG